MKRILVIGDVHGAYRALIQALERANYNPDKDYLIFLGDVADGWPDVKACFDFIVEQSTKYKNVKYLLGNHDEWLREWGNNGGVPDYVWWIQGGKHSVRSYHPEIKHMEDAEHIETPTIPKSHLHLLNRADLYHIRDNRLFVHAGVLPDVPFFCNTKDDLIWNIDGYGHRILWETARWDAQHGNQNITDFDEIFVGHTSTFAYSAIPIKACNVWNLDQGCGWHGKLSIMDIRTYEYWQSDLSSTLYPEEKGKRANGY